VAPTTPTVTVPGAPTGGIANALSQTQIALSWVDNSTDETGFKIERSIAGTDQWVAVSTVSANVTSFSDSGLTASTGYQYRISAINGAGASDYATATATTLA